MTVDMKALKAAAEWATKEEGDFIDALRSSQAFRALANPSTILSLIERCEELEWALTRIELGLYSHAKIKDIASRALSKADATS